VLASPSGVCLSPAGGWRQPLDNVVDNGWRWRVLRTSNAYNFREPGSQNSSKSDFQTGTPNQEFFPSFCFSYNIHQKFSAREEVRDLTREGQIKTLLIAFSEACREDLAGRA